MSDVLGGRWLRELADACALEAAAAVDLDPGHGIRHTVALQDAIKAAARERGLEVGDVVRAVVRQWQRTGLIDRRTMEHTLRGFQALAEGQA